MGLMSSSRCFTRNLVIPKVFLGMVRNEHVHTHTPLTLTHFSRGGREGVPLLAYQFFTPLCPPLIHGPFCLITIVLSL